VAKDEEVMEMLGEYLRELSVLILVFVPLELTKGGQFDYALTVRVAKASGWLLFFGIIFGKWNRVSHFFRRCYSALHDEFSGGKPNGPE
jgi:hypothetical protein